MISSSSSFSFPTILYEHKNHALHPDWTEVGRGLDVALGCGLLSFPQRQRTRLISNEGVTSPWVSDNPRQERSHWALHMDDFSLNDVPRDRPKLKVTVLLPFVKADLKSSNKSKLNPRFFHTPKRE